MRAEAMVLERQNQWQLCCIKNISPIMRNERSLVDRPCRLCTARSMPWACTSSMRRMSNVNLGESWSM